jgi:hypothetical protein
MGIIGTNLVAKHYAVLSHPKAALLKSLGRCGSGLLTFDALILLSPWSMSLCVSPAYPL